jgi:hypothetical protein
MHTPVFYALIGVLLAQAGLAERVHAQDDGPRLEWYGYVKLDASWDQRVVSAGNFARWVLSSDGVEEHSHFNMTARQTRLGFRVRSEVAGAALTARWEGDFYGGGAENKNALQVRHAHVRLRWPSGWEVVAGQASDVVSPLAPNTLNYTVNWWAGNVGYRRPLIKVARAMSGASGELRVEGALSRTIGDDFGVAEPGDTGADSGVPTLQGRVAGSLDLPDGRLSLGVSVHRGREEPGSELGQIGHTLETWSRVLDLQLGLRSWRLAGELWEGCNLDDYLGGVGQGVHVGTDDARAVRSSGGWVQLGWEGGATTLYVGAGLDDPRDDDLGVGRRARNGVTWVNLIRDFGEGLEWGFEASRWETDYVDRKEGRSVRVQSSLRFAF